MNVHLHLRKMDWYYTSKQIHLKNVSYLDGWSMDKGKEHRKSLGKLIDYANTLAPPLACVSQYTKTERSGSPFWYHTLYCHKFCFRSLKGNVLIWFDLMFWLLSFVGLVRFPCNAWVQDKGKKCCLSCSMLFSVSCHRKFCTHKNKSPVQKAFTAGC